MDIIKTLKLKRCSFSINGKKRIPCFWYEKGYISMPPFRLWCQHPEPIRESYFLKVTGYDPINSIITIFVKFNVSEDEQVLLKGFVDPEQLKGLEHYKTYPIKEISYT